MPTSFKRFSSFLLGSLGLGGIRPRVNPKQTVGVGGTQVVGGYIVSVEKDGTLNGRQKYERFAEILTNVSIVGAAVRNFLNLVSSVEWKIEPAEDGGSRGEEIAELVEAILDDMTTPWHRVVRKAAMYKFHGFSIQEWTAKLRDDGVVGFRDIEARPQFTIEQWDLDESGTLHGVVQRSPQDGRTIYLPRPKLLYMVDDTMKDTPEGLGLFRHLIEPAKRLQRYEQLEGFGYETDLKGIPIGRAPLGELAAWVRDGRLTADEQRARLSVVESFLENHVRTPQTALMLDSETFRTLDESSSPSAVRKWDMELLSGGGGESYVAITTSIARVIREIARLLNSEHLLLGESGAGSLAMHKDKTSQFAQMVDSTVREVIESVEADILPPLFELNGWPKELMPVVKATSVAQRDVAEVTSALAQLATAGAVLTPDDEAIGEIFDMLGLTRPKSMSGEMDLSVPMPGEEPPPEDGEEPPPEPTEPPATKRFLKSGSFGRRGKRRAPKSATQRFSDTLVRDDGSGDVAKTFDESEHPRADDGKWTDGASGGVGAAVSAVTGGGGSSERPKALDYTPGDPNNWKKEALESHHKEAVAAYNGSGFHSSGRAHVEAKGAADLTYSYSSRKYEEINNSLRRGRPTPEAKALQELVLSAPPTPFEATAYRGDSLKFKLGEDVKLKGLTSVSFSRKTALAFAEEAEVPCLYEIKLPKGSRGVLGGMNVRRPEEAEALIASGAKFRVRSTSRQTINGKSFNVYELVYKGV